MATFVSGSGNSGTTATTISVTAPASIVAGNLLVAFVYSADTGTTAPSAPSGWTQQYNDDFSSGTDGQLTVWTKVATGSEPTSYTFGGIDFLSAVILQYSGVNAMDATPVGTHSSSAGTAATTPTITAASTNDMMVVAYGSFNGASFTTPAGFTARTSTVASSNTSLYSFEKQLSASGAAGTTASTQSASNKWMSVAVLLKQSATDYTSNPADNEPLTDAANVVQAQQLAPADSEPLTDAATAVLPHIGSGADTAGLTDGLAVQFNGSFIAGAADAEGLTDAATAVQAQQLVPADPEGLTGATTVVQTVQRSAADSEPLIDAAAAGFLRTTSSADTAGLTDAVTAALQLEIRTHTLAVLATDGRSTATLTSDGRSHAVPTPSGPSSATVLISVLS